jgi:hypothetical protein
MLHKQPLLLATVPRHSMMFVSEVDKISSAAACTCCTR